MKVIKKTKEYVVYQKASGRYAVKDADKKWVNADEKVRILLAEGLIKAVAPAAPVVEEAHGVFGGHGARLRRRTRRAPSSASSPR